ncbi:MAG: hypothetical protein ACKOQ3_06555 [Novosphingobium sp.]
MLTYAIAILFVLSAAVSLAVIAHSLHRAAPQVADLWAQLRQCSDAAPFRFRIVEIVTGVNDGKVVRLPVRARQVPQQGLRAAA